MPTINKRTILSAVLLLAAMGSSSPFSRADDSRTVTRKTLVQKAAFTALRGDRARIIVSNFGTTSVLVKMRFVEADDSTIVGESPLVEVFPVGAKPPGRPANAGNGSFFDVFFEDAGECRSRAEVEVFSRGPTNLGVSTQLFNSMGQTQLFTDRFELLSRPQRERD